MSFLLLSGVGACVRVWNGVDDVLCGVQAHKCPKGGLEPLSVESPILGMRPGNHYTMPAFENFTEGKERSSCCLPTTTPCLTITPCQLSNFFPREKKRHRVSLVLVVVVRCGRVRACVERCGWCSVRCSSAQMSKVRARTRVCRISDSRYVAC